MPRTGKEMIKLLVKHGYQVSRVRGSHHYLEKEGAPPVSVPVHGNKPLAIGTEMSILKLAGLKK